MTEPVEVATRLAYRDRLPGLMADDPAIFCLDTDTGTFAGVDFGPAAARYLDFGIAEHTVVAAAAGLAAAGATPFVNTMATFASTRALEAVKVNVAHNDLPVRIVATHGGVAAAHLGPTHYALEDLAVMRALPNMTVVVPADAAGTVAALEQAAAVPGPVYLRLGRKATPPLPPGAGTPQLGRIQALRAGDRVVIVCCGPHPVLCSLAAAEELAADGVAAAVLNAHTVAPLDVAALLAAAGDAELVVTVEEHRPVGGLGGVVAETLASHCPRRLLRIGLTDAPVGAGDHEQILHRHGISAAAISRRVRAALHPDRVPVRS